MDVSDVETQMMLLFSRMIVRAISHESLQEVRQFIDDNLNFEIGQYMPLLANVVKNHVTFELNRLGAGAKPGQQTQRAITDLQYFEANSKTTCSPSSVSSLSPSDTRPQRRRSHSTSKTSPLLEMRKRREAKIQRRKDKPRIKPV